MVSDLEAADSTPEPWPIVYLYPCTGLSPGNMSVVILFLLCRVIKESLTRESMIYLTDELMKDHVVYVLLLFDQLQQVVNLCSFNLDKNIGVKNDKDLDKYIGVNRFIDGRIEKRF